MDTILLPKVGKLDPRTREYITKYLLPKWFVGSDSQIIRYVTELKRETYSLPEVKEFLLELGIKSDDLLKDPFPYFVGIRWEWNLWADLLFCEVNRNTIIYRLREKSLMDIHDIVCQKRPSTSIDKVYLLLRRRGEQYLDIDIFVYTDKAKKLTDPAWGITSNSEYRFYAMLSSLELGTIIEIVSGLKDDELYCIDSKEIVSKRETYKYSGFKICSDYSEPFHHLLSILELKQKKSTD